MTTVVHARAEMNTHRHVDEDGAWPSWISRAQYAALQEIITYLDQHDHPYVATGGLAGNLHGSRWPLHDVDLDLPRAALDTVADWYRTCVRFGPGRHVDDEFDIELLTIQLHGIDIALTASESITLREHETGRWIPWPSRLDHAEVRVLRELRIRVQPLASVVAYKQCIGRVLDVADLRGMVEP